MADPSNIDNLTRGDSINQSFGEFKYNQELSRILKELDIDPEEVCLSGSVSFAVRNIRSNNDIDIITNRDTIRSSDLPKFCDITRNSFEMIGVSDDQILQDPRYHDIINGFKIIRPELVFSYKKYHERPKDKRDLELLQEYAFDNPDDWNWELVTYQGERRFSPSSSESIPEKTISSLRKQGIRKTAAKGYEQYLQNRLQDILNSLFLLYSPYSLQDELTMKMPVDELLAREQRFLPLEESAILSEYIMFRALYNQKGGERSKEEFVEDIAESAGISLDVQKICVPISWSGRVTDPTQFAAALFLGMHEVEVEIRRSRTDPELNQWVEEKELSGQLSRNEARLEMLRTYGLLFYAILWPAVEEYFDEIEGDIAERNNTSILRSEEITFGEESEFAEFVWDIYIPAANPDWSTRKKIHKLRDEADIIRVLEIEVDSVAHGDDVQGTVNSLKNEIRDEFRHTIDEYFHDIIIHMGDSYEENRYILWLLRQLEVSPFGDTDSSELEPIVPGSLDIHG